MRKLVLLSVFFLILVSSVPAQEMTLDPNQFVNAQILADTLANGAQAHTVYKVESGQFYAFDGSLEVDFDLTIVGPDNGWIMHDPNPPVFLQIPSSAGASRDMINLRAGGSVKLKNILLGGLLQNDANISSFVRNYGGYKIIWDNCAFSDHIDHCTRSTAATDTISITNCVFINGVRRTSSPFGGMPIRLDAACKNFLLENNTSVNSGRLLGNGGNFFTSKFHEIHNTFLNMQVNGHEIHWYEGIQANNIFYNWSWRGRKVSTNTYEEVFTTVESFSGVKEKLDSIALYQGRNLFYLDPFFKEYWHTQFADSIFQCYLWNNDVDSTIEADNNFTIGKNFWQFDPKFTSNPTKIGEMLQWTYYYWINQSGGWVDWRIQSPVSYNNDGQPVLHWPPTFDLSYTNDTLLTAGTDGLPLGDLNWFPAQKATYMANRAQYIAALQDSMTNAKYVYIPGDSLSSFITWANYTDVETYGSEIPNQYYLSNNYPNPFNPTTTIRFGLPQQSKVTLSVFNILGQKVFEATDKDLAPGVHSFDFNASRLSSGIYVYRIHAVGANGNNFVTSKKMMLLK